MRDALGVDHAIRLKEEEEEEAAEDWAYPTLSAATA
jgi:hypothetical protein